ncbi:MAG TPA: PQQ-dependent dehydrogenase, methanol/ethanol family [Terriglobales bacterium]|nr:PQQ-dependent dehydrogenase, methanol/ethanol family [Terriglobales bacterium]
MNRLALILALSASLMAQVPYERILKSAAQPENWLTYSGNYQAYRYSTLDQITRQNVHQLKVAWMYQMHAHHKVETSPLVFDGIMYITEPPSDVTALDLRTGRPIWSHRRSIPPVPVCCGRVNRGVAALDDQLFVGTLDAHLLALDMKSGRVRWDVEVADYKTANSITLAPLVVKGKVIIGIAGAEYGIRGFLDAYDAKTGKRAWRFWTVPGPGEPGNETWSGDSWKHGGAPTWLTGSYDPEVNLLYWGTGNPGPNYAGDLRKGDNLYSDCLIALDADTGRLKWHFQFTPHDVNDIDANEIPVLVDAEFRGKPRKLVLFGNRNGFYYILDRLTGEFLHAKQFATQTWAKGLDEHGRPISNPASAPSPEGATVYPDDDGAANWYSPSYNPQTGLFYQNAREKGAKYYLTEAPYVPGRQFLGASRQSLPGVEPWGALRALDALTGEMKWEFRFTTPPWSGILSTAGGLVFSGDMEGNFFALDAAVGKPLWWLQTGGAIWAAPITYMREGRQFVAIAAGSAIVVFSLDK